jgi:hypothetical protein
VVELPHRSFDVPARDLGDEVRLVGIEQVRLLDIERIILGIG